MPVTVAKAALPTELNGSPTGLQKLPHVHPVHGLSDVASMLHPLLSNLLSNDATDGDATDDRHLYKLNSDEATRRASSRYTRPADERKTTEKYNTTERWLTLQRYDF